MNEETKQKIIDFNNQFGIRTEFITGESTLGYALGNTIYINTSINQDYEKPTNMNCCIFLKELLNLKK